MVNAGVAKLIPQDLVYSRTAPNAAHVSSERAHQKTRMIAQPNAGLSVSQGYCDAQFRIVLIVPHLRR
ncbi:hypothetical protein IVA80_08530 [Bradyrhizobium sp. 139]|uniref:hypothetical protein n=1 Tax=Bradyrhizobium sp. 139 TaxID=2782616 RepID=UPI001FFB6E60|nr:hypothetical protein [Bradyrhizobium sp. 139]MCK1740922.1 hypothetical protein [Bradyrhizobium sp. 139]